MQTATEGSRVMPNFSTWPVQAIIKFALEQCLQVQKLLERIEELKRKLTAKSLEDGLE